MKRNTESAYFCPKCKSTNVQKEISVTLVIGAPQKWICNNCGHFGYLFPQATKTNKKKSS